MLTLAGVVGGMLLGEMAVGSRLRGAMGETTPYSSLSANPDAAAPQSDTANPCPDCLDSYGVAARLRAERDHRMGDEFRELGAVDVDPPTTTVPEDDYRYGGRFPDVAPRTPSGETRDAPRGTATSPDEIPSGLGASGQPIIY